MPQYRRVCTLLNTTYSVGDRLEKGEVSDITIEENWGEHLAVTVWVREWSNPTTSSGETVAVMIPYHAVELMVVK